MSEYSWRDRVDSETYWQSGLRELESENERLRGDLRRAYIDLAFLNESRADMRKHIVDLQSQLAWHPVSEGLPTEPGYYLTFDENVPCTTAGGLFGRVAYYVPGKRLHGNNTTHWMRVEPPKGGES